MLEMVPIPAGRFWMGSEQGDPAAFPDELPRHEVEISAFELARVPVTQQQYRELMGENPSVKKGEALPVAWVSWMDAIRFCNALSEREGLTPAYRVEGDEVAWDRSADGYRLPTEAEWEYAARGTDGRIYPWGNEPPSNQLCWDGRGNDVGRGRRNWPCPVGSYPSGASPFGVLDMAGNVDQWCWDRYGPYQRVAGVERDPSGPLAGDERVIRGSSYVFFDEELVRAAGRCGVEPSTRGNGTGLRCARGPRR